MVNIKGGAVIALLLNISAWTLVGAFGFDVRNLAWIVGAFMLSVLTFIITAASLARYFQNLRANPQSLAKLSLKKQDRLIN